MRDDTPDDLVHELFSSALFPAHPLGREVLGSEGSITQMPRDRIAAFHGAHYTPSNVVMAVAGNVSHEAVVARAQDQFPAANGVRPIRTRPEFRDAQRIAVLERDTEQAHVVMGVRGLAANDPDRYALTIVNQVLGGGMSSRLFQEVREVRGLAYSVYSYPVTYDDTGMVAIYAGTAPERVAETLSVIDAEIARLIRDGLDADEIAAAKGHLTGSLQMGLETSASRMRRIGRAEMIEGQVPSLDEVVGRIERVTPDDIARIIDRVFNADPRTLAVVGPHTEAEFA
jgi:predicted Zn-dependent peptidase